MSFTPLNSPSVDECFTLKISTLKKWGYLQHGIDVNNRIYTWEQEGQKLARISYSMRSLSPTQKLLPLKYRLGNHPVKYTIDLDGIPPNLGNGIRWYFICPATGRRCLHLICPPGGKYFLHRSAYPELMYESQKKSKSYRKLEKTYGWMFGSERLHAELNQKYRKRHYRGWPTPLVDISVQTGSSSLLVEKSARSGRAF